MGKLSPNLRPSDDAVSLHTQAERYVDDDAPELGDDDLPPLYDDDEHGGGSSSAPLLPLGVAPHSVHENLEFHQKDAKDGAQYYMDTRLDHDPEFLETQIQLWAQSPPRPFVRLHGTHTQRVRREGKNKDETVTDFDVNVELTPYLYSDPVNRVSWTDLRTAEDWEKVRRGTVLSKRASGGHRDIEPGNIPKPTLSEWCHRYCASHAGLKSFVLQRCVVGLDEERIKEKMETLVRSTNYRGRLHITFPVQDAVIRVYNSSRTNRWRLTAWIYWLCIFTLMFIFTWPYLFLRTKRFEVVFADWSYSTVGGSGRREYVSISEDRFYNLWGRAIGRAVVEKRRGTLDQQDLVAAESPDPVFGNAVVDGTMSFLRAGIGAMNEVNRQLGWGADC